MKHAAYATLNVYLVSNLFVDGVTGCCSHYQQNCLTLSTVLGLPHCYLTRSVSKNSAALVDRPPAYVQLRTIDTGNTIPEGTLAHSGLLASMNMLRCKVIMLCHDDDIKLLTQAAANPSERPTSSLVQL